MAALYGLSRPHEAQSAMAAIEKAAPRLSPALRVLVRGRGAEAAWEYGEDCEIALPLLEAAIAEAPEAAPQMLPRLLCVQGAVLERLNKLSEARVVLEHGIDWCDDAVRSREAIRLRAWLGVVVGRLGNPNEGIAIIEAVLKSALKQRLGSEAAQCCIKLCYLCEMTGDTDRSEHWSRLGLEAPGAKSTSVRALLLLNLASLAADKGKLQEALALSLTAEKLLDPRRATFLCRALCIQALVYARLGEGGNADLKLDEASSLELTPTWRRVVAFISGRVNELRGDSARAFDSFTAALAGDVNGDHHQVYEMRTLAGIARTGSALGLTKKARKAVSELRSISTNGSTITRSLLLEAEGFFKLHNGRVLGGCDDILRAAELSHEAYWRTHLWLVVADARGDRGLFLKAIRGFEAMGAAHAADHARARARAHGLRPGRKRAIHGVLSDRETSVALLVANGKTNAEIGKLLHVTPRTVEYHIGSILAKCGLRSRVEIATRIVAGRLLANENPPVGLENRAREPYSVM